MFCFHKVCILFTISLQGISPRRGGSNYVVCISMPYGQDKPLRYHSTNVKGLSLLTATTSCRDVALCACITPATAVCCYGDAWGTNNVFEQQAYEQSPTRANLYMVCLVT